ncbi:MAG: CHAT domain-containing protein [Acidobacteria bacterium]|nr:CHAT domain-containing protein [Acidobacteriota bacterium]
MQLARLRLPVCVAWLVALLGVTGAVTARQEASAPPAQAQATPTPSATLDELLAEARTLYLRGQLRTAYERYAQAQQLAERQGNKSALMTALRGFGNVYYSQGEHDSAYDFYQRSLKLAEELQDQSGKLNIILNLGNISFSQGDYGKAFDYYQHSSVLAEQLKDDLGTLRALNNIGSIYQLQGNFPLALATHQRALKLGRVLKDADLINKSLNNLGLTQLALNEYTAALATFEESLKLAEANGFKPMMMLALNNLAVVHEAQGQYALAESLYQQSLLLAETLSSKESQAFTWSNLGNTRRLQGDYRQAIELTERAIGMARQIGNQEVLAKASMRAGKAYAALGQFEPARQNFATAIQAVEQLRTLARISERDRQSFLEARIGPYYGMIELLIAQSQRAGTPDAPPTATVIAEALEYAQRAKGRVLLDVLQSGKADFAKAMTPAETAQERKLTRDLTTLNAVLYLERLKPQVDEKRVGELEKQLQQVRFAYEEFQVALYAAHPELKLQRGELQPLSLREISALLPDAHTAILEFIVAEEQTYLFVITKPEAATQPAAQAADSLPVDLRVHPLNLTRKEVNELTERFRRRIANRYFDIQEMSGELYRRLLEPAQRQLQHTKTLIIIPDGGLWQLPFQALQAGNNRYLIEDYALAYAPSLPVLQAMTRQKAARRHLSGNSPSLLALGNPLLGKMEQSPSEALLMGERLAPLPETARQVNALKQVYGAQHSKVLLGAAASEDLLKAEAGHYQILHLATHGILNDASPLYSQLLLSQPLAPTGNPEAAKPSSLAAAPGPGAAVREDGLLEAWEIMRMNLQADLVVLSACETARGRIGSGEGIIGLTWAFFIAGSPANVVSQWKVESRSTADLMLAFHRQLQPQTGSKQAHPNTAEALRQAALTVLRKPQYRHPFYWAGFILIGASQ